eukprot:scaffold149_cov315-Pinguiococcus_pyrenoidosus.AAC.43
MMFSDSRISAALSPSPSLVGRLRIVGSAVLCERSQRLAEGSAHRFRSLPGGLSISLRLSPRGCLGLPVHLLKMLGQRVRVDGEIRKRVCRGDRTSHPLSAWLDATPPPDKRLASTLEGAEELRSQTTIPDWRHAYGHLPSRGPLQALLAGTASSPTDSSAAAPSPGPSAPSAPQRSSLRRRSAAQASVPGTLCSPILHLRLLLLLRLLPTLLRMRPGPD